MDAKDELYSSQGYTFQAEHSKTAYHTSSKLKLQQQHVYMYLRNRNLTREWSHLKLIYDKIIVEHLKIMAWAIELMLKL